MIPDKKTRPNCDGECQPRGECYGQVLNYEIVGSPDGYTTFIGLKFNYCEHAAMVDTAAGFLLKSEKDK
jgi:hypothetical protein